MQITNAKFTALGFITALIDGAETTIPQSEDNRHYAELQSQGIVPEPYVPAPPAPEEIRAECARRMAALVAQYSAEERETWPIQVAEAQAVMAGQTEGLVMLPELAAARGLPVATFAGAVLQVANATKAATAHLLGAQAKMLAMAEIPNDYADDRWWQ